MHGLHKFLLFQVVACLGQGACGSEIIDGEKAPENSMLYMASVQNKGGHVCGGFLVSEDFVMTAAHCEKDNLTRVVLGTHNIKNVDEGKIRYIEKMYKHQSYQDVWTGKDIMLLKLSRKAELNKKLQTTPLPRSEIHLRDNTKCYVAGWGSIKTGGRGVDELRVVDVSVINPRVCREILPPGLPNNVICAGGYKTKKGFCQGDSGGPLVCGGTAVGIVSFNWEKNCSYPHLPNVYTDVSKYLPWIKTILKRTKRSE